MSVRSRVKTLAFHDGEADGWGDSHHELEGWNAKFRLELHGDDAVYGGTARTTPFDYWEPQVNWDKVPPGDRQFLADLESFVGMAFRHCVLVRLVVVKPVDLDEVDEYLAEEEEWDEDAV
jgi:hypothetical protein